jgi:hypothetical protein
MEPESSMIVSETFFSKPFSQNRKVRKRRRPRKMAKVLS